MAKFNLELPTDIMNDIKKLYDNSDEIFGEMTRAGAKVVESNLKSNAPKSIKDSDMMKHLKVTKTYKTKSDDGINTKVGFFGKFTDKDGREKICEVVGNVFEYGRSNSPFPKHPFLRKSFKKADIEKAMREAQKKSSGGLIDE